MDPKVKAAIASIGDDAWTPIEYTDAVFDEQTQTWVSRAEVAEIGFTAFTSKKQAEQVPGRLVVRRIPDLNPAGKNGQATLFDTWRFHAFFTTTDPAVADTVAADKTHRGHAIIEQVHADLKHSALAHLPSGKFTANAAWLVLAVMAFNLTRAAAPSDRPRTGQGHHRDDPPQAHHRARPGRVLRATGDPAPPSSLALGDRLDRPVQPGLRTTAGTDRPDHPADTGTTTTWNTWQRGQTNSHAHTPRSPSSATATNQPLLIGGSRLSGRCDAAPHANPIATGSVDVGRRDPSHKPNLDRRRPTRLSQRRTPCPATPVRRPSRDRCVIPVRLVGAAHQLGGSPDRP